MDDSLQSQQTKLSFSQPVQVLQFILDSITKPENPYIHVRGVHPTDVGEGADADEVTDFDFQYDCSRHFTRGDTYMYLPGKLSDQLLDVSALQKCLQNPMAYRGRSSSVDWLVAWACERAKRPSGRDTAGLCFEHRSLGFPTTADILKLAAGIAYSGNVKMQPNRDRSEFQLKGFGQAWPPESQHCLQIRTTWKWTPQMSNFTETEGPGLLADWEYAFQQAMAARHHGPLEDDSLSQTGLPALDAAMQKDCINL